MTLALGSPGLSTQTEDEIVAELVSILRATFGNNLNTSTSSIMGQLVRIISELRAFDQQVLLAVYRSFDPNSAIGQALDRLCSLTGTVRKGEQSSVVNGVLTFSGAGTVNNGDLIQNDDNETTWIAVNGPYVVAGPGTIDATFAAADPGPILANANTNWSLVSAVPNLDSFANPTDDAALGRLQEADGPLRVRRQTELFSQGSGPLAAIKAVVSKVFVPGFGEVDTVRVYHNPDEDPIGTQDRNKDIPFKAFMVAVETTPNPPPIELQQAIADAIFSVLGGGGQAFGKDFVLDVVDIEGQTQPGIGISLIAAKDIFIRITVDTTGTEQVISDNLEEVIAAAVLETAIADFRDIGRNQLALEYETIVGELKKSGEITGVVSAVAELSDTATSGPFSDPLEVEILERPDFESVNIEIVVLP